MLNDEFAPDGFTPVRHPLGDGHPRALIGLHLDAIQEPVQVVRGVGITGGVTTQHQALVLLNIGTT